jgi:hypothetical protein
MFLLAFAENQLARNGSGRARELDIPHSDRQSELCRLWSR